MLDAELSCIDLRAYSYFISRVKSLILSVIVFKQKNFFYLFFVP